MIVIIYIIYIGHVATHSGFTLECTLRQTVTHRGTCSVVAHHSRRHDAGGITSIDTICNRTRIITYHTGAVHNIKGTEAVANRTTQIDTHDTTCIATTLLGDETQLVNIGIMFDFRTGQATVIDTDGVNAIVPAPHTP